LPGEDRREDGDYALTNDARFYSKMDFPRRPKHFRLVGASLFARICADEK
jgi:hypothetical protein